MSHDRAGGVPQGFGTRHQPGRARRADPGVSLQKTSGANCNGYSCDILCLGNGRGQVQRDVLIDAEGSQIPLWGGPIDPAVMAVRTCEPQP